MLYYYWSDHMKNSENNDVLNKTVINWLIPIYSNYWKNPLFIRTYEN